MAERAFKRKHKSDKPRLHPFASKNYRPQKEPSTKAQPGKVNSNGPLHVEKFGLHYNSGTAYVMDPEYIPYFPEHDDDTLSQRPGSDWEALLEDPPEGESINLPLRRELESKFKRNFGAVQIHDGPEAKSLTETFATRAFAYRQHIWLGSSQDKHDQKVLAHELTHVVQQGYAGPLAFRATPHLIEPAVNDADYSDVGKADQRAISDHSVTSLAPSGASPVGSPLSSNSSAIQTAPAAAPGGGVVQGFDLWDAAVSVGESIVDTGVDVVDYAGEVAGDLLDMGIDGARAIMRTVAPDFLKYFDDGGLTGMVNDIIIRSIDSLFSGVLEMVRRAIDIDAFASGFQEATGWFERFSGDVGEGICDWILGMASNVSDFFSDTFGPVIDEISSITCKVKGFLQGIWESIGAPIWDFLQEVGGEVWQEIQDLMSVLGDLIDAGKDALGAIWDTAKDWFGIEAESGESEGGGLWNWISDIASDIGESIAEIIEPVMGPLRDAAGVLLLFVPGGQILAVILLWPRLKQAFDWLTGVWEDLNLIPRAREYLTQTVFPFLMDIAESVGQSFLSFADWIIAGLSSFLGIIRSIVSSIPSVLMPLKPVVDHVLALGQKMLGFARNGISYVSRHFRSILRKLLEFILLLGQALLRLITIVLNPFGLVGFLVGAIWQLLPDCIKGPLINFILDILIGFIRLIPNNPLLGILWPLVKNALLGFLETVRALEIERKAAISNKMANIIAGGSVGFFFGYLRGLIEGLWETITAPFQALAALFELPTQIQDFLSNLGVNFCELLNKIRCFAGQLVGRVFGSVDNVIDAIREFLSDPQRIVSLIRCAIEGILSGARELGSQLAQGLVGIFEGPDEEIGRQAGRISAQVLIQAVIAFFTAGAGAAVSSGVTIVNRIAGLLRTVGRAVQQVVRVIRGLFGRLVSFLRGLASRFGQAVVRGGRSVLGRLGDLFRKFTRWLARIGRRMFRSVRRRFRPSAAQQAQWVRFKNTVRTRLASHPEGITRGNLRREYGGIRRRFQPVAKWPAFITKHGAKWRVWARKVRSVRPRRITSVLMDRRNRWKAGMRAINRAIIRRRRRSDNIRNTDVEQSLMRTIKNRYHYKGRPSVSFDKRKNEFKVNWAMSNNNVAGKGGGEVPPPNQRNRFVEVNAGRRAKIENLCVASIARSSPSGVLNPEINKIKDSPGFSRSSYVRGHLISGWFTHGRPNNWAPISQKANQAMELKWEGKIAGKLRDNDFDDPRKFRNYKMEVRMTGRAGRSPVRKIKGNTTGATRRISAEGSVPANIRMKIIRIAYDGSTGTFSEDGSLPLELGTVGRNMRVKNVPNNSDYPAGRDGEGREYAGGFPYGKIQE